MITGASDIGLSWATFSGSQAKQFAATFSPGVDYFFWRNVSVGIDLDASYGDNYGYGADGSVVETRTEGLSGGPRFGLNVPISRLVSFFPRLTVGLEWSTTQQSLPSGGTISVAGSPLGYSTTSRFGPWFSVYLGLLFHVAPHFFVGVGPSLSHDFANTQGGPSVGGEETSIGAGFVVGGTWGGSPPPLPAGASPDDFRVPHFGEAGQVVLDGELEASVGATWYEGSSSSSSSQAFGPAIDWFVANHFSLGVGLLVSHSNSTGLDPTTQGQVSYSRKGTAVEPRIGVDVPLTPLLSLYPRAGFQFGGSSYDEIESMSEDKYSTEYVALSVYAPLLVHATAHLFVGFGPSLYWELYDTYTFPNGGTNTNRETSVGAGLVVGGNL